MSGHARRASKDVVESLSTADQTALLTEVYEHELPPVLRDLVDEYQHLEHSRSEFIWKWVHNLAPQNTLPCVDSDYVDNVPLDKTLVILYITLLDDILEKGGDRATFRRAASIPFEADTPTRGDEDEYVAFTRRVWQTISDRIRRGPAYDTYEELFRYDIRQAINSIEYTDVVIQNPELATVADLRRYESHNMVMFAYADIDLMHTTTDIGLDYATLREGIWHAQMMARIGNWLSTWERELAEGDYSAGVVVYALQNGIISLSELRSLESGDQDHDELVERIRAQGVENVFFDSWDDHYSCLREIQAELTTMDLEPFVEGTKEVLRYHLTSAGLK